MDGSFSPRDPPAFQISALSAHARQKGLSPLNPFTRLCSPKRTSIDFPAAAADFAKAQRRQIKTVKTGTGNVGKTGVYRLFRNRGPGPPEVGKERVRIHPDGGGRIRPGQNHSRQLAFPVEPESGPEASGRRLHVSPQNNSIVYR